MTVSNTAALSQDFTSNFGTIGGALTFIGPDGMTALLDGVCLAPAHMKKAHNPLKALVMASDGEDNNRKYNLREILRRAVESDVLIYTIGVYQNRERYQEMSGPQLLSILSAMTGGEQAVARGCQRRTRHVHDRHHSSQSILSWILSARGCTERKVSENQDEAFMPTGTPRLKVYARTGYYIE